MADLISMRHDAMEARKRIDSILSIEGELSAEQASDLENADKQLRSLTEQIKGAEVRESATEALNLPTYEPRTARKATVREEADSRQIFLRNLKHAMRTGGLPEERTYSAPITGGSGGEAEALMPVDLQDEMIRLLSNVSAVRQAATVRSYANDVEIPAVSTRAVITDYTGEGEAFDAMGPEFSKLRIRSFKSAAETQITEEVLNDSRGGIVSETLQQHAEAHGYFWETKFLGTGIAQNATDVDGILTNTFTAVPGAPTDRVMGGSTSSGSTAFANVTYEDLVETAYGMPAAYWNTPKSWIVGPVMYRALLELTDSSTGRPLFLPQATGTIQNPGAIGNLLGYPVLVSDAMPADDASTYAAVLLSRESYVVADRTGVASQVDPYSYGGSGITAYRTFVRSDGRWLRPTSSARLVTSAS